MLATKPLWIVDPSRQVVAPERDDATMVLLRVQQSSWQERERPIAAIQADCS